MKNTLKRLGLLSLALVLIGQGCFGGGSSSADTSDINTGEVTLEYWRVFDDDDTFDTIVDNYQSLHPNVSIDYRELRFDEYEDELIRAFAEDRGPDLFTIHNMDMHEYSDLLLPMPESVVVTETQSSGGLRSETVTVLTEKPTMTMRQLDNLYVEQVVDDVVMDYQANPDIDPVESIFGLPMGLDSMVLYYNRDLLSAAGIAAAPETWADFQDSVIAITDYDSDGNISQSAAAMGTADNVERAADILSVLMMQNHTEMTDERGRVSFHQIPDGVEDRYPGLDAIEFYTDFANPTKEVYTWNDDMGSSFEAFANGQTAFFFGYSYHIPLLRTVAPKLNFQISGMPQIDPSVHQVHYANYWIEGVAANSDEANWAWDFLLFATAEDQVVHYLEEAGKPTALRSLITEQLTDDTLGIFAEQILLSTNWYHGADAGAMEKAMGDLIEGMLANPEDPASLLVDAAKKVSQSY